MDDTHFLNGSMRLDGDAARRRFKEVIADPLGKSVEEAAIGIYRIASAQITDLIRQITVERGLDPRDFVLHAFGGTCGMLAGTFSEELAVRRVIIPYTASINCAFGLLSADVTHEMTTTVTLPADVESGRVNAIFERMSGAALRQLRAEGFTGKRTELEWSVDLRYRRQVHEVKTPVRAQRPLNAEGLVQLVADFEVLYEQRYGKGSAYREAGIEMTMFRLTARGLMARPRIPMETQGSANAADARIGRRPIYVDAIGVLADSAIYDFARLRPGMRLVGPAVIHTPITTIAVQAGHSARMDAWRNIVIEFGA
jgi:N-methylhydantoinase A